MAISRDIIKEALRYNGVKASPAGNVLFNTKYYGGKVNGKQFAWCAVFLWYIFRECKASKLYYGGKKTALVSNVVNYCDKKRWTVPVKDAKAGDIVVFDFSGRKAKYDHIGLVLAKVDGNLITIEGNTSSGKLGSQSNGQYVAIKIRDPRYVSYVARPEYDEDKKVDKTPIYSVGKKYTLLSVRNVRIAPDTDSRKMNYNELSRAAKKQCVSTKDSMMKPGSIVTCRGISENDGNVWIKIPSGGWIAAYYRGVTYVEDL